MKEKLMLGIIAGYAVNQSKISKEAKISTLNFLEKEATIPQIKAFLLDGEIVKLDEEAEKVVNQRFKLHELDIKTGAAVIAKWINSKK